MNKTTGLNSLLSKRLDRRMQRQWKALASTNSWKVWLSIMSSVRADTTGSSATGLQWKQRVQRLFLVLMCMLCTIVLRMIDQLWLLITTHQAIQRNKYHIHATPMSYICGCSVTLVTYIWRTDSDAIVCHAILPHNRVLTLAPWCYGDKWRFNLWFYSDKTDFIAPRLSQSYFNISKTSVIWIFLFDPIHAKIEDPTIFSIVKYCGSFFFFFLASQHFASCLPLLFTNNM